MRIQSSSKVGLVDIAPGNNLVDAGIAEENEKGVEEMRKERDASSVLVEVASVAAPTSNLSPLEYSSRPITPDPSSQPTRTLS